MQYFKHKIIIALLLTGLVSTIVVAVPAAQVAAADSYSLSDAKPKHQCGANEGAIEMSVGVGCYGDKCKGGGNVKGAPANYCTGNKGAGVDMTFAFIRFLSNGVGLVLIASLVYAGVQYTMSRNDPQAVAAAQGRIQSVVLSLFLYVFAYALLNYLIPGKFLAS